VLSRISAGESQAFAEQHCLALGSPFRALLRLTGQDPEPHQHVPCDTAPALGGMGQVNCIKSVLGWERV